MPRYRITGPDGALYDVDAPDDEAVQQAVGQMFGASQQAAAPAAPPPAPNSMQFQQPGIDTAVNAQGQVGPMPGDTPPPTQFQNALGDLRGVVEGVGGAAGSVAGALPEAIGYAGRGARRGIAAVAGLPVDLMNLSPMLFNLLPGEQNATPFSPEPFGGAKSIDKVLGGFGLIPEPPAPTGVVNNMAERVGQEMGAALLPMGAALSAGARLGTEGAQALPGLARVFVEPAAMDPTGFVKREMTAAAAAGTGAGLVNAATGSRPGSLSDFFGALGGAGLYGLANTALPYASRVKDAMTNPDFMDEATKNNVVDSLLGAAGLRGDAGVLRDEIINGKRVSETVPGFQDSLADRTGRPGIAALEYGRQSGPNGGMFAERRTQNTAAVDNALQAAAPEGTPGQFRDALDTERQSRLDFQTQRTEAARQDFEAAMQRLNVTGSDTSRGSDIRAALEDAKTAARGVEREAWRDIAGEVDPTGLAQSFSAVTKNLTDPEKVLVAQVSPFVSMPDSWVGSSRAADPLAAMTGLSPTAAAPASVSIKQVTSLRSALTDAERSALAGREENKARLIGQYVDALDNYALTALPPEITQAYASARAVSRDLNDRFTRPTTAIAQTLAERGGAPALDPSAVPGKFTPTDRGRVSDYQALRKEGANDPRVAQALEGQVTADARQMADNPDALDTFRSERRTMLSDMPELDQRLATAAETGRNYAGAQRNQSEIQAYLGTPNSVGRSAVAKYLTYGDEKAANAMKAVVGARDPARAADDLLRFVGDAPEAVAGARAAFWRVLEERSRSRGETTASMTDVQPWMPKALKRFLDDPSASAVADRLWRDDPEHLKNIREIADALQSVDLRTRARAPATSGTAQGVNPLLTPETMQSRLYAYMTGRVSASFLVTAIASVTGRRAIGRARETAFNRLLDNALLNPEVASILLKENNPANRAALRRGGRGWFGNEASTIINLLTSEDQPDGAPKEKGFVDRMMEMVP